MNNVNEKPVMINLSLNLHKQPEFLLKSTLGVAFISILLIMPFAINNFIQDRYLLGVLSIAATTVCAINVWYCSRGEYQWKVNCFLLAPIIIIAISAIIYKLGVTGSLWPFLGVLGFYFLLPERLAWLINFIFISMILVIAHGVLDMPVFIRFMIMLILTSIFAAIFIRIITSQQDVLRENAVTDALTGLYNRSLLEDSLQQAIQLHSRTGEPMTLITLDIDHFKKINDTYGHDTGDQVLKNVAGLLQNRLRRTDKVFRLGGEEFLVLLHGIDKTNSKQIAEELRDSIATTNFIKGKTVTASLGIATLHGEEDMMDWLKRSDENLYTAKMEGRNKIIA